MFWNIPKCFWKSRKSRFETTLINYMPIDAIEGCQMGRSDKVSLWYEALLINTRFCFFILD